MSQTQIELEQDFDVPPSRVWDAISDHEGMSRWLDAKISVVQKGDETGVGTVRRVKLPGGLALDEQVVYADAPRRLVYRIVRGAPFRFHRGEMIVEPRGTQGARLTWRILLVSGVPGLAMLGGLALGPALRGGLAKLAKQLEG